MVNSICFFINCHILYFFSYVLFTTESIENKTRKITNVSFLDKKLQNKEEESKSSKLQEKKQKKIDANEAEEIKPKVIDNFEEYFREEETQKRMADNADVVEQISYKVIKDIEALWIRPNSAEIGMFADFELNLNRSGIIET